MLTPQAFLGDVTLALSDFLARELPRLERADWWKKCVLAVLTPQQCENVARRRITSLSGLDLSALLRILDQNWNGLSASLNWPREVRNFVKETQGIRNRWAHAGSHPSTEDDNYRDLDTLQRLVQAMGDEALTAKLGQAKREIFHGEARLPQTPKSDSENTIKSEFRPEYAENKSSQPTKHIQSRSQTAPGDAHNVAAPDLVLIGCVKTKLPGRHKAKDLFTSPLFAGRRRRAEATGMPWFILSAKYGLLSPDSDTDYYDVSLNSAGRAERRRWSARVLEQLKKSVGSVAGKVIEVHAGKAYHNYGLVEGLKMEGATVVIPLEHARQGEQLAWYVGRTEGAPHATADTRPAQVPAAVSPPPFQQKQSEESRVEIVSKTPITPFTFRWPENTEEFISGWELCVRFDGESHRVRYGIGRRHCFGRTRVHTVTWLDRYPMVEGAEAEDFAETRDLVSVLKVSGGNHDAQSLEEVDAAYAAFRVVRHCDAIAGANARRGLAVRIRDDDLQSWAHHALLRARAKPARPTGTQAPHEHAPSGPVARSVPVHATNVVRGLLAFGSSLTTSGTGSFTPDAQADAFVRGDAFAFLVAVICDEQVRFEAAWEAPLRLRDRLGHWEIRRIAAERDAVRAAFAASPALHRWVTVTPDRIVAAATRVVADYHADAGLIWSDQPSAQELRERLERFDGIGQKKSAMAVELLDRMLHVPLRQMTGSDVAVDVHVRRVFLRTGLADRDDAEHIVAVARSAHPDRPGELDYPAWEIGRKWCRPTAPDCEACPIGASCPRLIDRAAGV